MICFCGDSYIEELLPVPPKSWIRMVTNKLYTGEYDLPLKDSIKYSFNTAMGGTSIEHLIEEQLIKKVLPRYPHNPFEYLIISVTYNERFSLHSGVTFTPGKPIEMHYNLLKQHSVFKNLDDDTIEYYLKSQIDYKLRTDNDNFNRRKIIISNLVDFFSRCGTKVFMFNVDSVRDFYADEKYYCKKKTINFYIDTHSNIDVYSNHFTLENNIKVADEFYNEIINL